MERGSTVVNFELNWRVLEGSFFLSQSLGPRIPETCLHGQTVTLRKNQAMVYFSLAPLASLVLKPSGHVWLFAGSSAWAYTYSLLLLTRLRI